MKFGKLVDGKIRFAKFPLEHDGKTYIMANEETMFSFGYKEVINVPVPTKTDKGIYKSIFTETDTRIVQSWEFVSYTEEQLKEKYKKQTIRHIREKYSVNQEFAILREYMTYGEEYKEAFDEYSVYVESCKAKAHAEVYGDETSV